jgi:putative addiction module component (TIGR02574 family)
MNIEQLTFEALRLTPDQRAHLAESLWASLEDPFKAPGDMNDQAALALSVERDRQIEKGEVHPISHEEMMARLRR